MDRMTKMQQARAEVGLKSQADIQTQQALLPMKEASATRLMQKKAELFPPQPRALSGDTAGRLSLASQGEKFAKRAKGLLFPSGEATSFNRALMGAARNPVGRTFSGEAQDVEFYVKRAIDAQLRSETGAAVSPGELDRLTAAFMANAFADPTSAFTRLDELEFGLRGVRQSIDPSGQYSQRPSSPFEPSSSEEDVSGLSDEEILRGLE